MGSAYYISVDDNARKEHPLGMVMMPRNGWKGLNRIYNVPYQVYGDRLKRMAGSFFFLSYENWRLAPVFKEREYPGKGRQWGACVYVCIQQTRATQSKENLSLLSAWRFAAPVMYVYGPSSLANYPASVWEHCTFSSQPSVSECGERRWRLTFLDISWQSAVFLRGLLRFIFKSKPLGNRVCWAL